MYYKKFLYTLLITISFIFIIKFINYKYSFTTKEQQKIYFNIYNKNNKKNNLQKYKKYNTYKIINKNKKKKNRKYNIIILNKITWLIYKINNIYNDWIITIISISILIKLFIYPINKIQNKYNTKIFNIKKKLKKKKNFYKIKKNVYKLYSKYKIYIIYSYICNLIQIIIFLIIYKILIKIKYNNNLIFFWIDNLHKYDKYWILQIILGISIYYNYKKYFKNKYIYTNIIISIIITLILFKIPCSILIYNITNNILNII